MGVGCSRRACGILILVFGVLVCWWCGVSGCEENSTIINRNLQVDHLRENLYESLTEEDL